MNAVLEAVGSNENDYVVMDSITSITFGRNGRKGCFV
jgi:hypothetical protein